MKKLFTLIVILFATVTLSFAQEAKIVETEFKVFGNCGMCKSRIEKTMKAMDVKFAKWDKTTKQLKVAFDSSKLTVEDLMKRVAEVGHDTEKFKADDAVYAKLPKCCLYRDNPTTH